MPNTTRRHIGNRAASPAIMHENTRSRSAAASGGTPSLAREEADDQAAALIRQADGTSVDIKKHAGTIYFVHPDNKKRLLKVCPISTGDAMCRARQDFEIARGCSATTRRRRRTTRRLPRRLKPLNSL